MNGLAAQNNVSSYALSGNASLEKTVLIIVMLSSFLAPFMVSSVNLAVPSIGVEFKSSAFLLSWIVASYLLASAAFLLPMGRLSDIVGRKKIFLWGVVLFSFFSLLCGLSWSVESLIALRVLQGISISMIFSTGMAILTSVYPPHKRGRAMGLTASVTYIGLSSGPVIGGVMNHYFGWRSIFYFNVPLGILIAIISLLRLKGEWTGAAGEKFDIAGSFLYMVGLIALLYGFSSIATISWAKYALVSGVLLVFLFVRYELKVSYPLIDIGLFSNNAAFAFSNLAAMLNYSALFAVNFLMSLFLQVVLGYTSQVAGFILLSQPLVMALFSPFAGALSDRVEPRVVASWGMGLSAVGLIIFTFLNKGTPVWSIIANLALIGLGFALFSSPNNNAIMGAVEKRFYGVASSSLATMRLIGQAVSMAVVTLLMAVYVGGANLGPDNAHLLIRSTRLSFIVFAVICIGGVFASLARGNIKARKISEEK